MPSLKIYYYSGTHWDREWYQTFQGFRKRLVETVDGLIEGLEADQSYGVFHFDGQTIVLEDYLEIRPEMRERLTELIRKGRIVIGPWYDMPDEFLVSGESLIKNLRLGRAICHSYGVEPAKNAYICDIFGHSSQTPQIFRSMGFPYTVLGRGTNDGDDPAHFRWQSPDGSEVLTFKLCDANGYGDLSQFLNKTAKGLSGEEFDRALKEYVDAEIARTKLPLVLLMDALDHIPMRRETPSILSALKRLYPDAEIRHCSIDEFCREQEKLTDALEIRRGELCRPAREKCSYNHVITNTLSSRYPLKMQNDRNETALEKWASPSYALRKTDMAPGFLRVANKWLLQNHPHDSICGCSIDQVHRDMQYRFDQTREICEEIESSALARLGGDLSAEALTDGEKRDGIRLRVLNPLPYRMTKTVTAEVDLSTMTYYREPFGYEKIPAFRLYDAFGSELVYGYVRPLGEEKYEIAFEAELSPCGVTEFSLLPSSRPTRHVSRLLSSPFSACGDFVAIAVNRDGTVNLTDMETGECYENLLMLIDNGEIGDGWYHCAPNADTLVTPTAADVSVIENSAVRVTFRITQEMRLPKQIVRERRTYRSEETVPFHVTHEVTLSKGDRGITVHTHIDNNVCDHRLRLRLPTDVVGEYYEAAQAFGQVIRVCGDDPTTADFREYGVIERNMAHICAKREGKRGLAFLSAYGLHECGVAEYGNMDVTLFRSFRKTVRTKGEPDGQLLGPLDFCYRILPYTEDMTFADLQKDRDFLAAGTRSVTLDGGKAQIYRPNLELIGRNAVYSTAAPLENGNAEVRVYNPTDEDETVTLRLPAFATWARLVTLAGEPLRELFPESGKVTIDLPAFRIATVEFGD